MNKQEMGLRLILATGTLVATGCRPIESKKSDTSAGLSVASNSEIFPTEVPDYYGSMAKISNVVPTVEASKPLFQPISQESDTTPEIILYDFDATAKYSRLASSEALPDGTRLFTGLTPGDQSYGVSREDLPPFEGYSADNLQKIVNWFNLTESSRYQYDGNNPYCNIWAWDVSRALRAELPHFVKDRHGKTIETDANWLYLWLSGKGADSGYPYWVWGRASDYGWKKVSAKEASDLANQGYPAFAIKAEPDYYKHGHIALVIPGGMVVVDRVAYPLVASAGINTVASDTVYNVFHPWLSGEITGKREEIEYYVHTDPYEFQHNKDGLSLKP